MTVGGETSSASESRLGMADAILESNDGKEGSEQGCVGTGAVRWHRSGLPVCGNRIVINERRPMSQP